MINCLDVHVIGMRALAQTSTAHVPWQGFLIDLMRLPFDNLELRCLVSFLADMEIYISVILSIH